MTRRKINFRKALDRYKDDNDGRFLARPAVRGVVWDKTGGYCWYCGCQMNPFTELTIDHVVPKSEGGSRELDNLVPCCKICNMRKGPRGIEYLRTALAKEKHGKSIMFTADQIKFLTARGIISNSEAIPTEDSYIFYFEKEGLSSDD